MVDDDPRSIEQMLRERRLERVEVNPDHARHVIVQAKRHVETAKTLATTDDLAMAFTAAYDAARKACAAVLAVHGLRARSTGGAHRNTGIGAAFVITDPEALDDFEWMRQVRNDTEYPTAEKAQATQEDVDEGIAAAEVIVAACDAHIEAVLKGA